MSEADAKIKPVKFVHVKGAQFRSYHADGTWSVANAHNNVVLNFYIENPKMAEGAIIPLGEDGKLQRAMQIVGAGENDPTHYVVTRDMQCAVVLSVSAVAQLQEQLEYYLKAIAPETSAQSTEEKK